MNENGEKTAVVMDLQEWGELWEDFHDIMVCHSMAQEEFISWEELKAELDRERVKRHRHEVY